MIFKVVMSIIVVGACASLIGLIWEEVPKPLPPLPPIVHEDWMSPASILRSFGQSSNQVIAALGGMHHPLKIEGSNFPGNGLLIVEERWKQPLFDAGMLETFDNGTERFSYLNDRGIEAYRALEHPTSLSFRAPDWLLKEISR